MADAVSLSSTFAGFSVGRIGYALLVFFIAIAVVLLIGGVIFWQIKRKKLKYKIPLYKKIGSRVIKIAEYKAMDYKISLAGDKLWFVPKARKYIGVGSLQSAPNEYSFFEREDGEWINFELPDIDEEMKKAGVKYLQQDMRSQRIAISNILDQRFKDQKTWWDKYGNLVTYVIFYLVVAISMVVIFYQWSNIADKIGALFDRIVAYEEKKDSCAVGIVPALIMIFIRRMKNGLGNFF